MTLRLFLALLALSLFAPAAFAAERPVTVALIGDSTVASRSGWGDAFLALLKPEVEGVNLALSGRSSKSFFGEANWKKTLELKPTYLLIQFGHNDQPGKGPSRETDPQTTYKENLRRYITESRAVGTKPILVTSVVRRIFEPDNKTLRHDLEPYAEAARQVGAELGVPVVDLHARSHEQVEKLGPEGVKPMEPDHKQAKVKGEGGDHTHFNEFGGQQTAPLVAQELRRLGTELAQYLK